MELTEDSSFEVFLEELALADSSSVSGSSFLKNQFWANPLCMSFDMIFPGGFSILLDTGGSTMTSGITVFPIRINQLDQNSKALYNNQLFISWLVETYRATHKFLNSNLMVSWAY